MKQPPHSSTCIGSIFSALIVLISVWGLAGVCRGETNTDKLPRYESTNVIMISIDTMRYDHLGCYGYARETSPNIDDLAGKGVLFENFISQAVLTPISQMSIFTSQDPRTNGMYSFESAVDEVSDKTLPLILKYYGYTNAAFLGSPEFYTSLNVKNMADSRNHEKIFGRSFDVYRPPKGRKLPEDVMDWIVKNKNKKFFLWLPIGTVHWPYTGSVPAPFDARFDPPGYKPFFDSVEDNDTEKSKSGAITAELLGRIYQNTYYPSSAAPFRLSQQDTQYIISRYDAGIYYTDLFVGRLLSLLEKLKLADKTLVVLHSVHGEDLGEHGYYYHYDIYDTEIKNALIVKFPGDTWRGKRVQAQAQGLDVVPTILDYLQIPVNHEAQGKSLIPIIETGKAEGMNDFVFTTRIPLWEYVLYRGQRLIREAKQQKETEGGKKLLVYKNSLQDSFGKFENSLPPSDIAIRTNDWKLILRRDKSLTEKNSWWRFVSGKKIEMADLELYDIKNDPMEQKNLAVVKPDIVEKLKTRLIEWDASVTKRAAKPRIDSERFIIPYP